MGQVFMGIKLLAKFVLMIILIINIVVNIKLEEDITKLLVWLYIISYL